MPRFSKIHQFAFTPRRLAWPWVVPHPKKDLPNGTVKDIPKNSGVKFD